MTSSYNRKPKGHKHEINFETRLAIIRKNLATQEDRLEKLRSDRIYTKEYVGYNRILASVAKALVSEENAAKYKNSKKSMSATKKGSAGGDDIGLDLPKATPVKGAKGSSRGGRINKRDREKMGMSFDSMKEDENPEEGEAEQN
eukprot:CAMPEP_0176372524 /NCGR_PEP_ID=MMETSP0126-20121128/25443_1 /TAXON_ID=141414 ORGANISM="Strombidinopsis acuminatum, Strain SPMC142" /NCGR_SAMPLE_ID=MMETSP0126 /ASSEMBLY_ACC=CAM_ASM_000229 /LENGTH=143 /DNA_ID=CAMNT_0017732385 /DNA_START=179 /DNA_END=610 /DNA_ORIENTATION=+